MAEEEIVEKIAKFNERIFLESEQFVGAYNRITTGALTQMDRRSEASPVVSLGFKIDGLSRSAYAFGLQPKRCDGHGRAALIIPGSGFNQSKAIFEQDPGNYHYGVRSAIGDEWSQFVLVKPNEDFRAWHSVGGGKLSGDLIYNWHLNRGGSYSVSYLVEALAITKYLQKCFSEVAVVGLSQGGAAALLTSLQAEPDFAVVASGFSVLNEHFEWSGHNQLIGVPGYADLFVPDNIRFALSRSGTKFLFTWGRAERGTYKFEASDFVTGEIISDLQNVTAVVHQGGHVFPVEEMRDFLQAYANFG